MIFMDKMEYVAKNLENAGFTTTYPRLTEEEIKTGANTFMDHVDTLGGLEKVLPEDPIWKIKGDAIKSYLKEIDKADAVLFCNFDKGEKKNRVGDNSFLEMGYSFFKEKKIFVLQAPPYGDDKIEEVLGMQPLFLNGDISKLVSILQ